MCSRESKLAEAPSGPTVQFACVAALDMHARMGKHADSELRRGLSRHRLSTRHRKLSLRPQLLKTRRTDLRLTVQPNLKAQHLLVLADARATERRGQAPCRQCTEL